MSGFSARHVLSFLALVCVTAAPALAQSEWECLSGDCVAGTGRAEAGVMGRVGMTQTYAGPFQDGLPHGQGVMEVTMGGQTYEHYEGDYRDGVREGTGTAVWIDGDGYTGEWSGDRRHGRGVFTNAVGNRFEGEFRDDEREGVHEMTYADGRREQVRFRHDMVDEQVQAPAAGTLQPGQESSGTLSSRSTQYDIPGFGERAADDYSLSLAAGQSVTVRMDGDFDTYLRILDGTEPITYNDDAGSVRASEVTFVAPHAGTYTVRATTYSPAVDGTYTLLATLGEGGRAGEATIRGSLTDSGPVAALLVGGERRKADLHIVSVRAGQTLRIDMTSTDFDTYLRVEMDRERVAYNDDADGDTGRSYVEYTAARSGLYGVYAGTFSETGRGAYTLRYSVR